MARRVAHARMYTQLLTDTPVLTPVEAPRANHVYHLYVIRSPHRDYIMSLLSESGISTGIHYPVPVHRQKVAQGQCLKVGKLPITESVANEVLSLPMYPELTSEAIEAVATLVAQALVGKQ